MKLTTQQKYQLLESQRRQKMFCINQVVLSLLCLDVSQYDVNDPYLIGVDSEFNEDIKKWRYYAYINNEKIRITESEYVNIRNLWELIRKRKITEDYFFKKI